ncbi:exonuclease domain-containing protein [Clostridium sp. SHJSY1]|uniref:3'-5' exonuclease n=1 Tax=Clostridium sp. SHJSY1 TaxID=2942483 RepID=UPI00287717C5|nr:3'-5' exonuclease [Clostridium sp. SHJSY1]MDS0526423.1 exonuclease domain-containing protein [Clostridium sp. SHJSY1]
MNYIIFDLEFNQKHPDNKNTKSPSLMFEIIQIGALKLNEQLETIGSFNSLVKPTVHTTIHPYVEDLTSITTAQVSICETFPKIYENFLDFIGTNDIIWGVWGCDDITQFIKNIRFHNLSDSNLSKKYIDIQKYASKYCNYPTGCKIGLKNAVTTFNILSQDEFHNALNDAYYTSEVFKRINNKKIRPKLYSYPLTKRNSSIKETINTVALINQFEKIYRREMTNEEKEIIKLAYMMGKTKQFINE